MNPNGMRAWRRAARKWRHKQNRRSGAPYADGSGRWYRRQRAWFTVRPAMPSRPFLPRSLVGMSNRTRRWYARVELVLRHSTEKATNRSEGLALLLRWTELLSKPGAQEDYRRFLADRRIGERLRPCPGCTACLVCIACENDTCKRRHLLNQHCDGSGVLPARGRG